MFGFRDRADLTHDIAEKTRAAFRAPTVDAATRDRVLAGARARATAPSRSSEPRRGLVLRAGIVLALAAGILGVLMLQAPRAHHAPLGVPSLPSLPPLQNASAAVVLGKALAAVSETATVLHVIASTDTSDIPIPGMAPVVRVSGEAFMNGPEVHGTVKLLPPQGPGGVVTHDTALVDRIDAEHWIDRASDRRRSTQTETKRMMSTEWSNERTEQLVIRNHQQTVRTFGSSDMPTSTDAWERDVRDPASSSPALPDQQSEDTSQRLRDTSDPSVYFGLLKGRPLDAPIDDAEKPMVTHTHASMLGTSTVDGIPVYTLRIVSSTHYGASGDSGTDTTLVASIRGWDYLPVRVQGVQRGYETKSGGRKVETDLGQTWVTNYRLVRPVPARELPADTFTMHWPAGVAPSSNIPLALGQVGSAVPFPVLWLSKSFGKMQFTGVFRKTSNDGDYSGFFRENATVVADEGRKKFGSPQVVAEYSLSGKPANRSHSLTVSGLKVVTMPHSDPTTWDRSLAAALDGVGDVNFRSRTTSETLSIGSRPAKHVRREWTQGNGTRSGRATLTVDYLLVDWGNATVLVQGGNLKPGEVARAARALRVVR